MSIQPEIRQCGPSSVPDFVRIHEAAFLDRAMTALGTETVRRYYASILSGAHDVTALTASVDGEVAGFCIGGHLANHMRQFLRDNFLFLTTQFLRHPWFAFHGLVRSRALLAIRLLLRPFRISCPSPAQTGPAANVFSVRVIAVHPDHRRLGVGRALLSAIESHAEQGQFSEMRLAVNLDNKEAIQFYENLGWERLPGIRTSEVAMRKRIPGSDSVCR